MRKLEVEKFPAPEQQLMLRIFPNCDGSDATDQKEQENKLLSVIHRQQFTAKISCMVGHSNNSPSTPSSQQLLLKVSSILSSSGLNSYVVRDVPLAQLVNHDFTSGFTKTGSVVGLSTNSALGVGDSAQLSPSGRLSLLLTADTYQSLGLEGHLCTNILRRPQHKYVVHVNSCIPCFQPSKACYERTIERLKGLRMDVVVSWRPNDTSVCPSSLAYYFDDLGYKVEAQLPSVTEQFTVDGVATPDCNEFIKQQMHARSSNSKSTECLQEEEEARLVAAELSDSLGALLLNISLESGNGSVDVVHCEGLYHGATLDTVIQTTRSWLLSAEGENSDWCVVCLHSHPEAPFEWVAQGCGQTQVAGSDCAEIRCGCGMAERDHHNPGGSYLMVLMAITGVATFLYTTANVRHRYYAKTSNNK